MSFLTWTKESTSTRWPSLGLMSLGCLRSGGDGDGDGDDNDDGDGGDGDDDDDDGDQERVQVGGGGGGWREEVESQTGFSRSAACPPPLAGQPGEP